MNKRHFTLEFLHWSSLRQSYACDQYWPQWWSLPGVHAGLTPPNTNSLFRRCRLWHFRKHYYPTSKCGLSSTRWINTGRKKMCHTHHSIRCKPDRWQWTFWSGWSTAYRTNRSDGVIFQNKPQPAERWWHHRRNQIENVRKEVFQLWTWNQPTTTTTTGMAEQETRSHSLSSYWFDSLFLVGTKWRERERKREVNGLIRRCWKGENKYGEKGCCVCLLRWWWWWLLTPVIWPASCQWSATFPFTSKRDGPLILSPMVHHVHSDWLMF